MIARAGLGSLARWMAAAVCVHNAEEWLAAARTGAYPTQVAAQFGLPARPSPEMFGTALVLATVLPAGALLWSSRAPLVRAKVIVIALVASLFLVNAIVPHLVASIAVGGYTPGVATALAINLPLGVSVLVSCTGSGLVAPKALALIVAAAAALLPAAIAGAYGIAALIGAQ